MCNKALDKHQLLLVEVSDHLKTQEMCNKGVGKNSRLLVFVPDCLRTEKMHNEAVRNWPWPSFFPDHLRPQEMCNEIMYAMPDAFHWISERFK